MLEFKIMYFFYCKVVDSVVCVKKKTNDGEDWVCSCYAFLKSQFFICCHLVNSSVPKFLNELKIYDTLPFIVMQGSINENGRQNSTAQSDNCNATSLVPNCDYNTNTSSALYDNLIDLVDFLNKNIESNENNERQLKVIFDCLQQGARYRESVESYENRLSIPRTWSDLDKYTMFL
jgi:hypothetical protein